MTSNCLPLTDAERFDARNPASHAERYTFAERLEALILRDAVECLPYGRHALEVSAYARARALLRRLPRP